MDAPKSTSIIPSPSSAPLAIPPELVDTARAFASASRSPNTHRAYRRQWEAFETWCDEHGFEVLPASPATLALYLSDKAQSWKPAGLSQALAAISVAHQLAKYPSPRGAAEVQEVMAGIRRTLGTAQRQVAPLSRDELQAAVAERRVDLHELRDRALLLMGFAGAFRRSELVSLAVGDVHFVKEGMEVTLHRSKTDQEGAGHTKAIPYASSSELCPIHAVKRWLKAASIVEGPLFRAVSKGGKVSAKALTDRSVARVVKERVKLAGLDASAFSGHSLRAGFATAAARAGRSERAIQRQTGHKSVTMLRRYIREGSLWTENAAVGLLDVEVSK